jgi:hypothetical protein
MKFNWIDITILCLLSLSFFSGFKKSLVKGIINLLAAVFLISFILVCLDNIALPDFLIIRLRESLIVSEFLRIFEIIREAWRQI